MDLLLRDGSKKAVYAVNNEFNRALAILAGTVAFAVIVLFLLARGVP
jgi:hypothetical protein